jgi:predicted permease
LKGNVLKLGKSLFHVITEYLGILVVFFTIHSVIQQKVSSKSFLTIESMVMWVIGIGLLLLLIFKTTKTIHIHLREKKHYSREFLTKSKIGYEVGSFWDVVQTYAKEEELAIILGVNNRLSLDKNYLNKNSLVHNYVSQLTDDDVKRIEEDIPVVLEDKIVGSDPDGRPIYEYGSIYVVPHQNDLPYETALLSMCEPVKANVSQRFIAERKVLTESFEKMFEQMPEIFTNSTIIVPLIGTSSSGGHLSHEEVAKYLISAFADYSRVKDGRLAKRLVISIYNKDITNKFIDLDEIKRHIDNECDSKDFSYSKLKYQLIDRDRGTGTLSQ